MVQAAAQAYSKVKRDITLDLLRGYFLFVIIVDHLGSFPSIFEPFTGAGMLLVSAAEGFFFLSGLLVGRLRGNDVRHGNLAKATKWLWQRAVVLYGVSIALTFAFTLWARQFNYYPRVTLGVSQADWLEVIWRTLTLQYSLGLADMLPLYAVYMVFSVFALRWLAKGRWRAVLIVSGLVWLVSFLPSGPVRLIGTYFSASSWQILFFGGLVMGYHNEVIQNWWDRLGHKLRIMILAALSFFAAVGIAFSWALRLVPGWYKATSFIVQPVFEKIKLGPGRILLFCICIIVAYHGVKHFESTVNKLVGWFFLPLGQHSLFVYSIHSIIIFPFINYPISNQLWPASFLNIVVLSLVYLLTISYGRLPSRYKYL